MKRSLYILLVEDDPALGPISYRALISLGHRSVLAASGPAVYHHLSNRHEFELVLLDLQLGDQRSEPFIEKLRNEGAVVPVIVILSAQPRDELRRAVRSIGAHSFVQKPASIEDIQQAIELAAA